MLKTCDISCYELAEYFLDVELKPELHSDDAKQHLALHIQQCIEDEIEFMRKMFPEDGVKPC